MDKQNSPKSGSNDPLLHPKEAAKLLSVSDSWLAKSRMTGTGPRFVKICKRRSNNPSLKRPGVPVAPE